MEVILIPSSFKFNSGDLKVGLGSFSPRMFERISLAVDYHASRGESYMKTHAKWTDRTSAARSGLHSRTSHDKKKHQILLAHAVSYGVWLETRRDFHGRYAIILQALEQTGKELMNTLKSIIR